MSNESKQANKQTNNNQVKRNKQVNKYISKQAGAELCQAQVKLEVIVYIVEEALRCRCNIS